MNEHPARRPIRWEDLAEGLAWPVLLRLPAMAFRWSRLLLAYLTALPIAAVLHFRPETVRRLLDALVPTPHMMIEISPAGPSGTSIWIEHSVWRFARLAELGLPTIAEALGLLALPIPLLAAGVAMIARSTALEVARNLEVSPRYSVHWFIRRWRIALLWLWPIPFVLVLALPPALLLALAWPMPDGAARAIAIVPGTLLVFFWLLLSALAVLAAPLAPAAYASDDGDAIDLIQRTIAITLAHPVRLLLCYAWIGVVTVVLLAVLNWFFLATLGILSLPGERLAGSRGPAAMLLAMLSPALATSTLGSGLTLTYLYLRRVADEQDFSEVPMEG